VSEQHPTLYRLTDISPKAYEHPADRAATAALQSIPMLDGVVRRLIEFGYERAFRQTFLASSVKLGTDQLPELWADYGRILETLDMPEIYDVYLTQFPFANAAAIGSGKPMIIVNSATVSLLDDAELRTVLAHEVGHVLSNHVLYRTALLILLRIGAAARLPIFAGLPLLAIRSALLEWSRAAELSCDRAAALVTRDPQAVSHALMVLCAGEAAQELNLNAFIAQGVEYEERGTGLERLTKLLQDLNVTHPMPVRRVRMLLDWVQAGDYDRIVRGEYVRRGEEPTASDEASAAGAHYSERIGDAIAQAGSSVSDLGDQLGEWLQRTTGKRERGEGPPPER